MTLPKTMACLLCVLGLTCAAAANDEQRPAAPAASPALEPSASQSLQLDPAAFFQKLVDRYRKLVSYRDRVKLVSETTRDGQSIGRVETQITCTISEGKLSVQTPASQARAGLELLSPTRSLPLQQSASTRQTREQYDLWLAPHMTLKFTNEPLQKLRAGVDEGFTPTDAASVVIADRTLVHLELKSDTPEGSEGGGARFDLYVNPESMLIERIEGQQSLPDGGSLTTRLEIVTEEAESEPEPQEPGAPPLPPRV